MNDPLSQIEERFVEEDPALRQQRFVQLLQDYFQRKEAQL